MAAVTITVKPEGICWHCGSSGWVDGGSTLCRVCIDIPDDGWAPNVAFEFHWSLLSTTVDYYDWFLDGPG